VAAVGCLLLYELEESKTAKPVILKGNTRKKTKKNTISPHR
jgi:hypothetical protein